MVEFKTALVIGGVAAAGTTVALGCVFARKSRRGTDGSQAENKSVKPKYGSNGARRSSMGIEESKPFVFLEDPMELHGYFLREIIEGEECLDNGAIDEGINHLCNALAVCSKGENFLAILKDCLAPQVYDAVLTQFSTLDKAEDVVIDSAKNETPERLPIIPEA